MAMTKLYKRIGKTLQYHEAWVHEGTVVEHWGECGDKGKSRESKIGNGVDEEDAVESALEQARADGFTEIEEDDIVILLVEYEIDDMGTTSEIEKRHAVEDLLNSALGWAGIGHVDGGSIGSGTMEVCCFVADGQIATQVIEKALKETKFADYTRIFAE
jgi:hypothetical protein